MEALQQAQTVPLDSELERKYLALQEAIKAMGSVITAFSGGVDSSLVAYLSHSVLGKSALAVTSCSESLTRDDYALTESLAADWGMAHRVIRTAETSNPSYLANPVNRCYFCKSTLYADLAALAGQEGFAVIINGTNLDDLGDHRPGLQAAAEYKVRSPLAEYYFQKTDIRRLAAHLGLRNARKPQAACLSSRVPYGLAITLPMLSQIEQAEQVLKRMGFAQLRVRHHGDVARIEVPVEDIERLLPQREQIVRELEALGYRYVTVDLKGFRSGSLNEGLKKGR
ncbi:MAG: ATP-dependent sacrificial sulfur transferase LarE [SAR324 cluster bacterium]|nr:ATP-dependent sacrificial sulfur transferase LarE [SAR324 cluster bacterium]MCZ6556734.1 ATP-dependent sacrificial sulfur transferase LarE [SAR324 cluster bacterium]MCZ6629125.1 ATP-dependent sacrificial sulfur transferase LarE [SAR324 cluster bacterium]MCZ6843974.1 ATP-dependent sacrificial sulfur transferase LarE [SAR324 cluster bacterium]